MKVPGGFAEGRYHISSNELITIGAADMARLQQDLNGASARITYFQAENMMLVMMVAKIIAKFGGPVELPKKLEKQLPRAWSLKIERDDAGTAYLGIEREEEQDKMFPAVAPTWLCSPCAGPWLYEKSAPLPVRLMRMKAAELAGGSRWILYRLLTEWLGYAPIKEGAELRH